MLFAMFPFLREITIGIGCINLINAEQNAIVTETLLTGSRVNILGFELVLVV